MWLVSHGVSQTKKVQTFPGRAGRALPRHHVPPAALLSLRPGYYSSLIKSIFAIRKHPAPELQLLFHGTVVIDSGELHLQPIPTFIHQPSAHPQLQEPNYFPGFLPGGHIRVLGPPPRQHLSRSPRGCKAQMGGLEIASLSDTSIFSERRRDARLQARSSGVRTPPTPPHRPQRGSLDRRQGNSFPFGGNAALRLPRSEYA